MKSKHYLLFTLMIVLFSCDVFAEKVEPEDAKRAAQQFMTHRQQVLNSSNLLSIAVDELIERYHDGVLAYYAINFMDGGFVILSADDNLKPVIGYAYQGRYNEVDQPCCFSDFMNNRAEEAAFAIAAQLPATEEISQEWNTLLNPDENHLLLKQVLAELPPLLTTTWNQSYPYNALCPLDAAGPGGRVYAGCVATAMAIIMHYWRYPLRGIGEKTHYTSYGTLYANFGATFYDWDGMLNSISSSSGDAILPMALIQYHCGIAVNMSYSPTGSGAYNSNVAPAIKAFFAYRSSAQLASRASYSYDVWKNLLKSQLNQGYPLYYSGTSTAGGHAWVSDGFQDDVADTYFHQNWGWGGAYNGFFLLTNLNPGNDPPFNMNQSAVINFAPPTDVYPFNCPPGTKIITAQKGSIEDGSGPVQAYLNNANCSYLIAPTDSVKTITLNFIRFSTQPNDIITIYNGANANAPMLGTFSGTNLPPSVTSTGNRMFITFATDGTENANGWLAEFSSTLPLYCPGGIVSLYSPSGYISDGSGSYNYNNRTLCRWWIRPPGASSVTLNFSSFATEAGTDIVRVVKMPDNTVLGDFSGNTLPGPVVSNTGQMLVMFTSNDYTTAQGFEATYSIGNVGIPENEVFNNFAIYPNPSSNIVNIAFAVKENQNVTISLATMDGKTVYLEKLNNFMGKYQRVINTSAFAPGVYILSLISDKATTNQKLIIE
ncbi:MAG: C10 family peptidase [Bacteroidales bacterium]|nr:C10 family peptidase [Bacteroidales bacterium]MDZ4203357.1 C10 family peptidase [Bacteroidales bacterium]